MGKDQLSEAGLGPVEALGGFRFRGRFEVPDESRLK
jgi:hypothetical protein